MSSFDKDQWRLGHRRPWWHWNVLTLFAVLFVLIWMRELLSLGYTTTLMLSVVAFTIWVVLPEVRHALLALWRSMRISWRQLREQPSNVWKVRLVLYLLVVLAWLVFLVEVFGANC